MGEAKEVLSLQMSRDHGREMPFFFFFFSFWPNVSLVTRKEEKKKGKRSNVKEFPKTNHFDIY